jgi:hypothetical protein
MRAVAACALVGALASQAAAGEKWNIRNIDTSGVGRYSSLQFDREGNAHIAYVVEDQRHLLKYAFWDHLLKRWFALTVAQDAAFGSLALDSKKRPHMAYVDQSGWIRYRYWDGSAWQGKPIPYPNDVAPYTSIALDTKNNPHILFVEQKSPSRPAPMLRSLAWNGQYWALRTVDSEAASALLNAMVQGPAGGIHAAYSAVGDGRLNLRYAYWTGDDWKTETADGSPLQILSLAIGVDGGNEPHIAYVDGASRAVKYAVRTAGKWRVEIATWVKDAFFADRCGLALDGEGTPYISFYDAGLKALKVAYLENNKWTAETVDSDASGYSNCVQLSGGTIWITYAGERDGTLKSASKKLHEVESARQVDDPHARQP